MLYICFKCTLPLEHAKITQERAKLHETLWNPLYKVYSRLDREVYIPLSYWE